MVDFTFEFYSNQESVRHSDLGCTYVVCTKNKNTLYIRLYRVCPNYSVIKTSDYTKPKSECTQNV